MLYKTVWEIPQKVILQLAADRSPFIDQSQSLNVHIAEPNYGKLTSMHFYAWKLGLKTGMYYLRTRPAAQPIKFTVDKNHVRLLSERQNAVRTQAEKEEDEKLKQAISERTDAIRRERAKQKENVNTEKENKENGEVAVELTEDLKKMLLNRQSNLDAMACSLNNREACESCSG